MAQTLKHIHILVKAKVREPKALSIDGLKSWVRMIIMRQKMEIVSGPHVVYVDDPGNEGPTGSANIKTSHMAFHIWENLNIIQADFYTCGSLDVHDFIESFEAFDPEEIEFLVIDRENGFKILEANTYFYDKGEAYHEYLSEQNNRKL